MSVLIKGMEMPTRCAVCVLCDLRYGTKCKITKMSYYDSEGYPRGGYNDRPEWCPLVEVKEPHGDLIDRDALVKDLTNGIKAGLLLDGYEKYQNINNMDDCVECAKYADAVIEAEGSENHDD